MNEPIPARTFDAAVPDYDEDGYGWAMAQARLIRARRLDMVDWDNVAEEIESVGKSERRAVESALRIVLLHRLKWRHQTDFRSRSWEDSIREHLRRFDREMSRNPGLKPQLDEILRDAYAAARYEARQETGLGQDMLPADPPSWDDIRAPLEP